MLQSTMSVTCTIRHTIHVHVYKDISVVTQQKAERKLNKKFDFQETFYW